MAISLPTTIYILAWPWITDSPSWHLRRGNTESVMNILMDAATVNDRRYAIPYNLEHQISVQTAATQKSAIESNWWSLWCDRKAIITMLALHVAWTAYVTNYNGMLLNIRAFNRDFLTANTTAAGFSEIFGILLAWFFVIRTPRNKWYWTGLFNIATGILSCFGFFIPETRKFTTHSSFHNIQFCKLIISTHFISVPENVYMILGMSLALLAKMATTCSQAVLVTCTGELVSPAKQKLCIFSCIVCARIGLLTAPFIGVVTFIHTLFPMAAFGVIGLIGGICTCLINYYQLKQPSIDKEKGMPSASAEVYVIDNSAW